MIWNLCLFQDQGQNNTRRKEKEKKYYKLSHILSRERRHGIKDEMSDIF